MAALSLPTGRCNQAGTALGCFAALVAALALVACGGTQKPKQQGSAEQQVTETVQAYLRAQTAGDGRTACALLTRSGQQQLGTLVMQASNGLLSSPPPCETAVGLIRTAGPSKVVDALAHARVEQVSVAGEQASAEVVDGSAFPKQRVTLQKVGQDWKIAGVPGIGG